MLSGFFQPSQMGGIPVMTQPTLIYSQPVMRPPNPFGPVPGAQVGTFRITGARNKLQLAWFL